MLLSSNDLVPILGVTAPLLRYVSNLLFLDFGDTEALLLEPSVFRSSGDFFRSIELLVLCNYEFDLFKFLLRECKDDLGKSLFGTSVILFSDINFAN